MVDFTIDLTNDFNAGTIKAKLAKLPMFFDDAAAKAVVEAATFIVQMAKILVRVDTGTLRKTIRKEKGGVGLHWREMRVRAGGYFVNPKTGKICDYAIYVEENYPYLRPAVRMGEPFLREQFKQGLIERV